MQRWTRLGVVAVAFLSACAGVAGRTGGQEMADLLQSLRGAAQRGEVGTVEGYLYLMQPALPTPLKDWPVTLIPLTPTLEGAVHRAKQQFTTNGRVPLSASALNLARRPITNYIKALEAAGHKELIREVATETGPDPKFTFQDVPHGRWLLLAGFPSKISVLLWAIPVTVSTGKATHQSLNDTNIWLEGLTK